MFLFFWTFSRRVRVISGCFFGLSPDMSLRVQLQGTGSRPPSEQIVSTVVFGVFFTLRDFFNLTRKGGVIKLRYLSVKTTSCAALARPGPTATCQWLGLTRYLRRIPTPPLWNLKFPKIISFVRYQRQMGGPPVDPPDWQAGF